MNYYLCNKCYGIIERDSNKKEIKSICDETSKDSKLLLIESADKLAETLRKKYLKNLLALDSFKPNERLFLEMAFEQGAKVVFNSLKNR